MDRETLLPCPFCGEDAQLQGMLVYCPKHHTLQLDKEVWNRRALSQQAEHYQSAVPVAAPLKLPEEPPSIKLLRIHDPAHPLILSYDALRAVASQAIERMEKAEAELNETFTDDNGTTWRRPTAWAYAQVCRVKDEQRAKAEAAEAQVAALTKPSISASRAREIIDETSSNWGNLSLAFYQQSALPMVYKILREAGVEVRDE